MADTGGQKGGGTGGFIVWMLGLLVLFLVLGLVNVWLNIERVDLAYDIKKVQNQLEERKALISKLYVERNNLVSPYRLKPLAKEYGLAEARSGQIRRFGPDEK